MQGFDYGRELLKWIAIVTMAVDHVGAVLYPEIEFLRWIGRLSFPLFAYLIVLGMESTRNVRNYFVRLFIFAMISQVPFFLALDKTPFEYFNIFFTLSFGVVFVYYFKKGSAVAFVPLLVTLVMPVDYGVYGIATIACFYFLRSNPKMGVALLLLLNTLYLIPPSNQLLSLAALPLILLHNNGTFAVTKETTEKFRIPLWRKYFFYVFYPLHFTLIYLIKLAYF